MASRRTLRDTAMLDDKRINGLPLVRFVACLSVILHLAAANSRAESVCLLDDDRSALEARLSMIASARCAIDAAYFEFNDDRVGRLVAQALAEAAQRGVKVRLLVDGYNDLLADDAQKVLIYSGVELREFHPSRWNKLHWSPHRMHDKLLIADGETFIVGGRNISSAYFEKSSKRHFSDRDVLIVGRAAQHATAYFESRWQSAEVEPVRADRSSLWRELPVEGPPNLWQIGSQIEDQTWFESLCKRLRIGQTKAESSPCPADSCSVGEPSECFDVGEQDICFLHTVEKRTKSCCDISAQLLALLQQARVSIVVETPYLVLTDDFREALAAARARGVEVRIITNSLVSTNKIAAQAGYECQKKEMLRTGIQLWEYQGPDTLHAKCWVVDDFTVVGSYNLDCRAACYDTQTAVVIHDCSFAEAMLASIARRHQSGSIQPTLKGGVYDPCQIEKPPSILRKALLQMSRPAALLVKEHL